MSGRAAAGPAATGPEAAGAVFTVADLKPGLGAQRRACSPAPFSEGSLRPESFPSQDFSRPLFGFPAEALARTFTVARVLGCADRAWRSVCRPREVGLRVFPDRGEPLRSGCSLKGAVISCSARGVGASSTAPSPVEALGLALAPRELQEARCSPLPRGGSRRRAYRAVWPRLPSVGFSLSLSFLSPEKEQKSGLHLIPCHPPSLMNRAALHCK